MVIGGDVRQRKNVMGTISTDWLFYPFWFTKHWDNRFSAVLLFADRRFQAYWKQKTLYQINVYICPDFRNSVWYRFFSRYSIAENTFPFYFKYQNVFFTLFLGLVALTCLEKFSSISAKRTDKIREIILQIISVAVIGIIAELFCCDYGLEGILYIAAFYVCRKNRIYQVLLFLLAYMVATGNQPPLCTLLACVLILLYNGKRGKLRLKYFFYAFYPIHIIILYLIRLSLTNFS